jgi:Skp family chaperone for outer membrane proteins
MFKHAVLIFFLAMAPLVAVADDDAPKQRTPRNIAVVDLNHLFKNHAPLKRELSDLQGEATLQQAKYESLLKSITKKSEELKDLTVGSREYKKLEEEVMQGKAKIQADIALTRKDFVQREAKLYFDVYQKIRSDVAKIAKSQGLAIVINMNRDESHAENPDEVARRISDKVFWFDESIDLTPQLERNYSR